ncbi:asparaginase domain-containing protein [Sphingobium fuliginis]|uniref:Asparaginase n=1 Tax=Sphingobium fuliginis ATCC 27551 TaxID=1208342 RepID=A0A5B8CB62_SPHSA|nr:asparaginase domain-containing protein [Sphingobium fuliginis]QDC36005.1 asparaginase [Sphingobium fuliginis ATCC 27551]
MESCDAVPETSILVLTTGGTIDKIYFDALSDYQVGETVVAKLLDIARVKRPFRIEEVVRKDSLELDDADRALIRDRVAAASESHIVITHGTDTMTETAKLLSAIAGKTVVLVGALAPARFGESDASFNLGMAFATVQLAAPGVYITMSGSVFRADRVVKDREKGAFVPIGE